MKPYGFPSNSGPTGSGRGSDNGFFTLLGDGIHQLNPCSKHGAGVRIEDGQLGGFLEADPELADPQLRYVVDFELVGVCFALLEDRRITKRSEYFGLR
ncbi:unnamed protein product [Strongylus vulgaris]|uniref:Uncharacterized protein n=1 Tax=Strongylus vulgaris TaxID=40348 RepID=A0A3P7LYA7_STRVU|nr:unnamed protein product [Strongylus vulgaris]